MSTDQPYTVFKLGGSVCKLHAFGTQPREKAVLFCMPVAGDETETIEGQHQRLDPLLEAGEIRPFTLLAFTVDWESALSPWPAAAIRKGQPDFRGNAPATLQWMLTDLLPAAEEALPALKDGIRGIIGYSMAGMFALWAAYQTGAFSLAASCSGSLWYQGFVEYMAANALAAPCSVYLSLGEREERVRHPLFSKVGGATRHITEILAADPRAQDIALIWHPGGHSGTAGERIAAALTWMAKRI